MFGHDWPPRNEELLKEIDDDYLVMKEVSREMAYEQRQRAPYVAEGLTEEEQLSYAMLLSQDASTTNSSNGNTDKDVEEAIKLSLQNHDTFDNASSSGYNESVGEGSSSLPSERPADISEEDWNLVMQMSMEENHRASIPVDDEEEQLYAAADDTVGSSSMHTPAPEKPADISEEDWQMIQAMELSMNSSQTHTNQNQDNDDEDLELAMKLSMLDSK